MSQEQANSPQLQLQRIYAKDISFEAPQTPELFEQDWEPHLELKLETHSKSMSSETYEVVLRVTVTTAQADQTAFICEVHQAGIFELKNFSEELLDHCLKCFCPNMLFPYAREAISNLVNRGSFPQLNLPPVNFDTLYADQLKQQDAQAAQQGDTTSALRSEEMPTVSP